MEIGSRVEFIQRRSGFHYEVEILRFLSDGRPVGKRLKDTPVFSAGGEVSIEPNDIVLDVQNPGMMRGECYSVITPAGRGMTVQALWPEDNGFVVKMLDGQWAGDMTFIRPDDFYTPIIDSLEVFDRD